MDRRRRRGRGWRAAAVGAALGLVAVGLHIGLSRRPPPAGELGEVLRHRGRIALLGGRDLVGLAGADTEVVPVEALPAVAAALRGTDADRLGRALDDAGIAGVLIDGRRPPPRGRGRSLGDRLRRYDHVPGLAGVYLVPVAAFYARRAERPLDPRFRRALAEVARGMLEGQRTPHLASFPEVLRRERSVEVMVLLREGPKARLWRSARGSSLAKALLTATLVARDRWKERAEAMGGPLSEMLPKLAVEVAVLEEDGTLGDRASAFLDRAITATHGVGYERKGTWRYLLPEQVHGAGAQAFRRLFQENGLDPESLQSPDIRLYRLVVRPLATSPPRAESASGAGASDP